MRRKLKPLLPTISAVEPAADNTVPEYPTQDELYDDCEKSEETTATETIDFNNLFIGDIVEVYWEGEDNWFEGEVMDVDLVEEQFQIYYKTDDTTYWHNKVDYPVRTTY